ncbi:ABC transporter ATP-binding protein [Aureimonas sp. AU20]|uniref:ABC transporter ATP-binding protein n=1 Tax=Aureimonas sp. AU20 TaxID=1349819 RepID=UPI0007843500|nr:ABC transporter ATP-binding protein [Aureimonas sp. AU20]
MTLAISARNVGKSFSIQNIRTQALADVSVDIHQAEFTLMIGPSGCGKSTLLSILSGMTLPDHGSVHVGALDLASASDEERDAFRLKSCGFIFQGFNLFPALNALEQVQVPLDHMNIPEDEARERARRALESVGLAKRWHLRPAEMSGGEKQRVAIARAVVKRPLVLFADEPTSALDSENGRNVAEILRSTAKETGTAVLCVSHDMRLLSAADRLLQMEDGRLRLDSRPVMRNGILEWLD